MEFLRVHAAPQEPLPVEPPRASEGANCHSRYPLAPRFGSAETQIVVYCGVPLGNPGDVILLRGLVQSHHFSTIQLILRLDYRQLALFFGLP
jgi:hypothetical protein